MSDVGIAGTITAAQGVVRLSTEDNPAIGIEISGVAWVAVLEIEATIDGVTFFTPMVLDPDGTAGVSQYTPNQGANGRTIVLAPGAAAVQVRASAFTSGIVNVVMRGTDAAAIAASAGGGGGGGAVTVADGADVTQGAKADVAAATDAGSFTIVSILKRLVTKFTTQFPAALTGSGNFKVSVAESTAAQAVTNANLDAALSTLGTQTTLAAILAKIIAAPATEATLALIKTKTDNLDVALSTRTKPADAQHAIIDSGALLAGGYTAKPTALFTRGPNTTPYAINDEVGTAGTAPTTFVAARSNNNTGFITGCRAVFSNNPAITPQFRVWVFSATVTLAGDNAALALSDADALLFLGCIDLNLVQQVNGAGGTAAATIYRGVPVAPIAFQTGAAETTLYTFVTTLNAWTPIANSETLQVAYDISRD